MTAPRKSVAHRSKNRSHQLKYLLSGRWLVSLSAIDRILGKHQRTLSRALLPGWIRQAFSNLGKRLRRTENRVLKASRKVSDTVAASAVGEGAKQLAKQGRSMENKASRFVVERIAKVTAALIPAPIQRLLKAMGRSFVRAFGVVFVFLGRWFKTRRYWHLAGGAPAFLLSLPLAYCMVRMPFYGDEAKAKHYRSAAAEAMQQKDYQSAELYYRKLNQLNAVNERTEFLAACTTFESGFESEAIEQFRQLAPTDRAGFAPAHLWLAQWHLQGKSGLTEDAAFRIAEQHLTHALDQDPGNPQARSLRALHFQRTGRWNEALDELRQVVKYLPQKGLDLARLYARQGRWQDARHEITRVISIYEDKKQRNAELTPLEYEIWSQAHLILGEYAHAEAVLEEGLTVHPNDPQLIDRLYEQYMLRASAIGDQRGPIDERLRLLDRCWQLKPQAQDPLILIGQVAMSAGPAGQAGQQQIRKMLDSAEPPAALHAIMGTLAAGDGRYEEAVGYLEKACLATPDDPQVLNNLAWVMLQKRSQLPQALELANRAVALQPDVPMYRETRGQLLLLLERYTEAIEDLQRALNGLGDDAVIHQAMADAYERLGENELARFHQQQAK